VFALDYTLWQAHVDCSSGGPFRLDAKSGGDAAFGRRGDRLALFRESRVILDGLNAAGCRVAAASRTTTPDDARSLLATLSLVTSFVDDDHMQIYPANKLRHFSALRKASGVDYEEMLFFDDERGNIRDVGGIGVTCVYVDDEGMTIDLLKKGIAAFRMNHKRATAKRPQ
jgi:magnesium-dependent phosphatase 1